MARDPLDDRIDYPTTDLEGSPFYSDNPAATVVAALIVAAIIGLAVYYFYSYDNPSTAPSTLPTVEMPQRPPLNP